MKHIYKSLNKFIVFISLVSVGFSGNNDTILDTVSMVFQQEGGMIIEATIEQTQVENKWTDYVTIEIIDSTKFIFIGTEQILKVDMDTIYTFTPKTNQIVVDHYYRNDFNLLTMLSGNLSQIKLGEVQKRIRDTIINFTIPQFESHGKIWVRSKNYYPTRIVMEDDLENRTVITINLIDHLGFQNQYSDYSIEGWEIIDLRE